MYNAFALIMSLSPNLILLVTGLAIFARVKNRISTKAFAGIILMAWSIFIGLVWLSILYGITADGDVLLSPAQQANFKNISLRISVVTLIAFGIGAWIFKTADKVKTNGFE